MSSLSGPASSGAASVGTGTASASNIGAATAGTSSAGTSSAGADSMVGRPKARASCPVPAAPRHQEDPPSYRFELGWCECRLRVCHW